MAQRITSATHSHLFVDDLTLIIHASPWCHRVETADQLAQDRVVMDTSTSIHSGTLSHSMDIARECFKRCRRTLESSDALLDRKPHQ